MADRKVLVTSDQKEYSHSLHGSSTEDESRKANDFQLLQKFLGLSNLKDILCESKSLDVIIIGDIDGSNIADGLIGVKLSEMSRSVVVGSSGIDEIVVYNARKEGIDVTLWNMCSMLYSVTNKPDHILIEIQKILDKVDVKILYINYQEEKALFNVSVFDNLTNFLGKEFWENTTVIINTHDWAEFDANLKNAIPPQKQTPYKVGVRGYLSNQLMVPKNIITTLKSTTINGKFQSGHLSAFFFYLVECLSSQAKGALLKMNMKRITSHRVTSSDDQQCIKFGFLQNNLSSELVLKKTIVDAIGDLTVSHKPAHGAMVTPAQLVATAPLLVPVDSGTKSINELTHFYTAIHDLQFGAHGEEIGTTSTRNPNK